MCIPTDDEVPTLCDRCSVIRAHRLHVSALRRQRMAKRQAGAKRELINTGIDKRYVRRRLNGTFKESDDVARSLAQDRERKAITTAKRGQGDRGDR
jgi:hypothetical protein